MNLFSQNSGTCCVSKAVFQSSLSSHLSSLTSHLSPLISHLSPLTSHLYLLYQSKLLNLLKRIRVEHLNIDFVTINMEKYECELRGEFLNKTAPG